MLRSHCIVGSILGVAGLSACDYVVPPADIEETSILAAEPFSLTPNPIRLSSKVGMKAVGGETSVCVVLKQDILDGDSDDWHAIYDSTLDDIEIFGTFHTANGKTVELVNGKYSWSRSGELVEKGELASCLRPYPNDKVPVGAEIDWIELGATGEIGVLGAFVYSTNKWDF